MGTEGFGGGCVSAGLRRPAPATMYRRSKRHRLAAVIIACALTHVRLVESGRHGSRRRNTQSDGGAPAAWCLSSESSRRSTCERLCSEGVGSCSAEGDCSCELNTYGKSVTGVVPDSGRQCFAFEVRDHSTEIRVALDGTGETPLEALLVTSTRDGLRVPTDSRHDLKVSGGNSTNLSRNQWRNESGMLDDGEWIGYWTLCVRAAASATSGGVGYSVNVITSRCPTDSAANECSGNGFCADAEQSCLPPLEAYMCRWPACQCECGWGGRDCGTPEPCLPPPPPATLMSPPPPPPNPPRPPPAQPLAPPPVPKSPLQPPPLPASPRPPSPPPPSSPQSPPVPQAPGSPSPPLAPGPLTPTVLELPAVPLATGISHAVTATPAPEAEVQPDQGSILPLGHGGAFEVPSLQEADEEKSLPPPSLTRSLSYGLAALAVMVGLLTSCQVLWCLRNSREKQNRAHLSAQPPVEHSNRI